MAHDDTRIDPDPKGLIRESYRIEGIELAECRSIFLDWALSIPEGLDPATALQHLLERHGNAAPQHPMTGILRDGLLAAPTTRRRRDRSGQSRSVA